MKYLGRGTERRLGNWCQGWEARSHLEPGSSDGQGPEGSARAWPCWTEAPSARSHLSLGLSFLTF